MNTQLSREDAFLRNMDQITALINYVRQAGVGALNEYQKDKFLGLTVRQVMLLSAVHRLNRDEYIGGVPLSRLAREVHMSVSATSHLVDTLEEQNLLNRGADAEDRRSVRIQLSESGKKSAALARQGMLRAIGALTSQLTDEENDRRTRTIEKIYHLAFPDMS